MDKEKKEEEFEIRELRELREVKHEIEGSEEEPRKRRKPKTRKEKIIRTIAVSIPVLILILLIFGFFTGFLSGKESIQDKLNISITVIGNECKKCLDMNVVLDQLPFAIKATEKTINESGYLIGKYDLEKFPAVIASGNDVALEQLGFEEVRDSWVFDNVLPYYDIKKDQIIGVLNMTSIEHPACDRCTSVETFVEGFEGLLVFDNITRLRYEDPFAQELIDDYNIDRFPVIFIQGDTHLYSFYESLLNLGKKRGEYLILEELRPPYYEDERTFGIVNITYINCDNCVDARELFEPLVPHVGVDEVFDAYDSRMLDTYDVDRLPTVIISEGIQKYPDFVNKWEKYGTVEDDGTLVFRYHEEIGANFTEI